MSAHPVTIGVLAFYLMLLIVIGLVSTRKSSGGLTDFFLAGRDLGKFTVALSAVSSGRSGWLVLGVTGTAYLTGLNAVWAVAGYITVEVFMFFYVARRFRVYSEKTGSITIPDILSSRYKDTFHLLRVVSTFIIIFFMIAYVGSQVVAGGTAFSSSLGISETSGMWLTAIIILLYTMLGGFHAVSKTDVLQALFMFFSLVVLPFIIMFDLGGIGPIIDTMNTNGEGFTSLWTFGFGAIVGLLGIGFGSPGNPHILVRYMSLKNVKEMRQAALIGTIWNVVMAWGAIMIGLAGRVYFPDVSMLPNENNEAIFSSLGEEVLNPFMMGILLVAVLAAIMSSADSQLLVGASAIVRDVIDRLFLRDRGQVSSKNLVLFSRISVLVLMLLSVWLAFSAQEFVFWMVLFAFGGLGACFGPALLLTFYWKRTTGPGILAGMITGLITVILVKKQPEWTYSFLPDMKELVGKMLFGVTYEAVPGFLVALIVTVLVSLATRKPENADQVVDDLKKIA
ncbi:SSS family solute:Na+ symporter/sodium/proline symporter [Melghiribacillus thermohalophilus]|uniref:Sodium/proline symporter n=1 Tax=Melghiribacillus thermohalophilus TaxID=1324956 RepID=A0A4R3MV26_9BACI|nr:sodium/proline symporter [Melghiribacillus thermohalophilus]TCT19617.1 SSS family solute:Na+ symporter/sodium/proline symporter [Melghiribacillus thermohalophilus]